MNINGIGVWLRFITPALLALCLFILTGIDRDVNSLTTSLNNHLQTDVSDIKERLARIEALIGK